MQRVKEKKHRERPAATSDLLTACGFCFSDSPSMEDMKFPLVRVQQVLPKTPLLEKRIQLLDTQKVLQEDRRICHRSLRDIALEWEELRHQDRVLQNAKLRMPKAEEETIRDRTLHENTSRELQKLLDRKELLNQKKMKLINQIQNNSYPCLESVEEASQKIQEAYDVANRFITMAEWNTSLKQNIIHQKREILKANRKYAYSLKPEVSVIVLHNELEVLQRQLDQTVRKRLNLEEHCNHLKDLFVTRMQSLGSIKMSMWNLFENMKEWFNDINMVEPNDTWIQIEMLEEYSKVLCDAWDELQLYNSRVTGEHQHPE